MTFRAKPARGDLSSSIEEFESGDSLLQHIKILHKNDAGLAEIEAVSLALLLLLFSI
jgi:hypothetical protein